MTNTSPGATPHAERGLRAIQQVVDAGASKGIDFGYICASISGDSVIVSVQGLKPDSLTAVEAYDLSDFYVRRGFERKECGVTHDVKWLDLRSRDGKTTVCISYGGGS